MQTSFLHNPQLDGAGFFWPGGSTGVLLLHGFTATTAEVRGLAAILRDQGHSTAGPLLSGHGTEPADLNQVSWLDWLADVEAAYLQLAERCTRVFVGGESLGASLALILASRHPEIAGVIGYAPAVKLALGWLDRVKLRLGAPFLVQVGRDSLDCADRWQGYPGLPLKGAIEFFRAAAAARRCLPEVCQPLLLMQGRLDTTLAPDAMAIILAGVGSTLKGAHWLEQSSHPLLLDRELETAARLTTDFMARAGPGTDA